MERSRDETWHSAINADAYGDYAARHSLYPQSTRALLDLLQPSPRATVLDLACGTGASTREILARLDEGGRVIGVDMSVEQLAEARKANDDARARFIASPAEELHRVIDVEVDAALCNSAFWQVSSGPTLESLDRVLRPGVRFAFNLSPGMFPDLEREFGLEPEVVNPADHTMPGLQHLMREIAKERHDYEPPARKGRQPGELERRFRESIEGSAFEVTTIVASEVEMTRESTHAWFSVPVFRGNVLPGLDLEQGQAVLDAAAARWKPADLRNRWINFVLEKG